MPTRKVDANKDLILQKGVHFIKCIMLPKNKFIELLPANYDFLSTDCSKVAAFLLLSLMSLQPPLPLLVWRDDFELGG